MTSDANTLAEALQANGQIPPGWDKVFRSVLREQFISDRIWIDEHDDGEMWRWTGSASQHAG